jgi:hypothetical protein
MAKTDSPLSVDVLDRAKLVFRGCHGPDRDAVVDAMRSNDETGRPTHPADLRATELHMPCRCSTRCLVIAGRSIGDLAQPAPCWRVERLEGPRRRK